MRANSQKGRQQIIKYHKRKGELMLRTSVEIINKCPLS